MDGDIKITELDYVRLVNLIHTAKEGKLMDPKSLEFLGSEIKRAKKVDSKKITPEFVTMNSQIEVTDQDTKKVMILKLVYPDGADFKNGLISILSPLGIALLGYKVGDTISFEVPKGIKKVKINKVLYQPEANGDFTV